uniref:Ribosomal RNA small subunit methyltransferase E n=1 Tax=Prevotella sp. GTC17253 TaxID=3236793 RepID=A0AB33IRH7_9BACT
MKESHFFYVPTLPETEELPVDEAQHAIRVLRLQTGDSLWLLDGVGNFYQAEVTLTTSKRCLFRIVESKAQLKGWHGNIHLAIAPTKNIDRIEWMVEKACEVGIDQFSFLQCKFSERKILRIDRLEKIMISAVKQSRKPMMPIINELSSFETFISSPRVGRKFIAHCYPEIERKDFFSILQQIDVNEDVTVLIGPEGDFSIDEVKLAMANGYVSISLGNSRLRTETAGLYAVMMAQLTKRR